MAELILDEEACLQSFSAQGHAAANIDPYEAAGDGAQPEQSSQASATRRPAYGSEYDLACAVFSSLVRSVYKACEAETGLVLESAAPRPGDLFFRVRACEAEARPSLRSLSRLFQIGLEDLARDFPASLSCQVQGP